MKRACSLYCLMFCFTFDNASFFFLAETDYVHVFMHARLREVQIGILSKCRSIIA